MKQLKGKKLIVCVGGMANVLQLIERQRERKANRSIAVSQNRSSYSAGSDMHSGATYTVDSLNSTHPVSRPPSHHLFSMEWEESQQLEHSGRSHISLSIFTSAKEVMFLPVFVCLSVCESAR